MWLIISGRLKLIPCSKGAQNIRGNSSKIKLQQQERVHASPQQLHLKLYFTRLQNQPVEGIKCPCCRDYQKPCCCMMLILFQSCPCKTPVSSFLMLYHIVGLFITRSRMLFYHKILSNTNVFLPTHCQLMMLCGVVSQNLDTIRYV